jgi:hypothetical protein
VVTDDLRYQCFAFPASGTPRIVLSDGSRVPQQFTALIFRGGMSFNIGVYVEPDGSGVCTSIGCVSEVDGERPWITDVIANLPDMGLRAWVRYAIAIAAKTEEHPDLTQWPEFPLDPGDESVAGQHWRDVAEKWHQQPTRRRKATTPARLREVATLYNAALAEGRHDPTVAVAEGMNLSRSQAAKLVGQCRRTSPPLLEPVTSRRKDKQ